MKQAEVTAPARAAMADEARAGYPYEICGALIGRFEGERAHIIRTVPFPNDADDAVKRRRFTIDPGAVPRLSLPATHEAILLAIGELTPKPAETPKLVETPQRAG